jgi:hypothetical protein
MNMDLQNRLPPFFPPDSFLYLPDSLLCPLDPSTAARIVGRRQIG